MGISIRDLAKLAVVSKNSIVRLEAGGVPQAATLLKICGALGIHVATLAQQGGSQPEVVAIHRHSDDRWFDLTAFGDGPIGGQNRPLTESERRRLVDDGTKVPLLILKSRLVAGRLLPTVLELYQPSDPRSHAGEEFVFVLAGEARITVGREVFELSQGESATFWSAEEHIYAPAPDSKLPVTILSIRIDDKPGAMRQD
jgi:transcriptional regulator with XRE-family HTH domain